MSQPPGRAPGASASTLVHSPFSVIFGSPPPCLSMHQTGRPFGTTAQTLSDGATATRRLPDGRLFDRTCASDARGCCCTAPRRLHRSPAPPTPPDRRLWAVSPPRPLPRFPLPWPSTTYYVPACGRGWLSPACVHPARSATPRTPSPAQQNGHQRVARPSTGDSTVTALRRLPRSRPPPKRPSNNNGGALPDGLVFRKTAWHFDVIWRGTEFYATSARIRLHRLD